MTLKDELSKEGVGEKHLPIVTNVNGGIQVNVGSVEHPMLPEHSIQWIEVLTDKEVLRVNLNPGDKPEAFFNVDANKVVSVREYCNLHGLWKA